MRVTKHLLEQFISLQGIATQEILEKLSKIGLEVESFLELKVADLVVVGKVLQKQKHPDADKLSVCQVDVGEKVLQIVCGASNVEEGQFVAVALEGAKLSTPKGDLVIKSAKLRGVESCGMLCSSIELGFPKLHDGIMVLDESIGGLELGRALNTYALFNNFVIEIGITPNRGDCLSVLGIARDLSVVFGIPLNLRNYKDENTVLGIGRVLQIVSEGNFSASVLYKVAEIHLISSPLEIKLALLLCHIALKNPMQDFLNYAMHNIGVILRAYSFNSFKQTGSLESLKSEIVLKHHQGMDCVCAQEEFYVVGVSSNENNQEQGRIILEASYLDPQVVSELIYHHPQIKKDSEITYKTTRGSNPDLLLGMQYLCDILMRFAQIDIYSSYHKIAPEEQSLHIKTTFESITSLLGYSIDKEEITTILKRLGFKIEASFDETFFMAIPPLYRHDIKSMQDVAEEILRIYGINRIQSTPLKFIEQSPKDNSRYFAFKAKRNLMKKASAQGFCETLHYLFYDKEKMQKLDLECIVEELDVLNPITNELNTLRTSLIPAMLDSIERNKNLGFKAIALCEVGVCYNKNREEIEKIAFVVDSLKTKECFPFAKGVEWDFYTFAQSLSEIIGEFQTQELKEFPFAISSKILHPFQSAWVIKNGQRIGYIGKINPQSGYQDGFVCEVLLEPLLRQEIKQKKEFSKYQSSTRDLTIMIDKNIPFSHIREVLLNANIKNLIHFYPLDLYKNESFGDEVALSLRFVLQSMEQTLQEEDLNESMQTILQILKDHFKASLRQ